jgi:hypothetical protein
LSFERPFSRIIEVKKLEEIYRQSPSASRLLRKEEEAKDDKVVYIQAFLKRQDDGDKAEG